MLKQRRDAALARLVAGVPYWGTGVDFDLRGDELTAQLRYDEKLIGDPLRAARWDNRGFLK